MSERITIQYDVVYAKTAELHERIQSKLSKMDTTYNQAQVDLQGMDGKANAMLMETLDVNRKKAQATSEVLHQLLSFIELSARQVEHDEMVMKTMYSMGGAKPTESTPTQTPNEGGAI